MMRRRHSLRLVLPLLLGLGSLLGAGGALALRLSQEERRVLAQERDEIQLHAFTLRNQVSDLVARGEGEAADRAIAELAIDPRVTEVALIDERGLIRYASRRDWIGQPGGAATGFSAVLAGSAERERRELLDSRDRDHLAAYFPANLGLDPGGSFRPARLGVLYLRFGLAEPLAEARRRTLQEGALLLAIWLLLAAALAVAIDRLVTRQVARLLTTMEAVEAGRLKARSGVAGLDELGSLGQALDRLIARVEEEHGALREALDFNQRLVAAEPVGIVTFHGDSGRCVSANRAAASILGGTVDQVLDINLRRSEPLRASGLLEAAERVLASGVEEHLERQFRSSFGRERNLAVTFSTFDGHGARHLLALISDETDRRQAEVQSRALEKQVASALRMESLGGLAGGVAHDMNNVLGAVLGLASLRKEEAGSDEVLREDMEAIEQACLRGRTMVKRLLGFARQGLAEEKPIDLNALIREAAELLERTTLQRVVLELDLAPGLRLIRGDAAALSGALLNLCVNSVDAMPDGGRLTLRTANEGPGEVLLNQSS